MNMNYNNTEHEHEQQFSAQCSECQSEEVRPSAGKRWE